MHNTDAFFLSLIAPWEQERRIIGMVKSPVKGNQLVLIKMESPVIYSDFVRPVCLSRNHDPWISSATSRCLFLGWGRDSQFLFIYFHFYTPYQITHKQLFRRQPSRSDCQSCEEYKMRQCHNALRWRRFERGRLSGKYRREKWLRHFLS